jgi:hypothetical protein
MDSAATGYQSVISSDRLATKADFQIKFSYEFRELNQKHFIPLYLHESHRSLHLITTFFKTGLCIGRPQSSVSSRLVQFNRHTKESQTVIASIKTHKGKVKLSLYHAMEAHRVVRR